MKANVQKLIGMAVLGLALFSHSVPAWAGQKSLPQVTIGTYNASGSMVGTRYSGDSNQFIACSLDSNGGVACSARDKTGRGFVCYSSDPRWATVVKAITDSSLIYFEASSNGSSCNTLIIENFSSHLK